MQGSTQGPAGILHGLWIPSLASEVGGSGPCLISFSEWFSFPTVGSGAQWTVITHKNCCSFAHK